MDLDLSIENINIKMILSVTEIRFSPKKRLVRDLVVEEDNYYLAFRRKVTVDGEEIYYVAIFKTFFTSVIIFYETPKEEYEKFCDEFIFCDHLAIVYKDKKYISEMAEYEIDETVSVYLKTKYKHVYIDVTESPVLLHEDFLDFSDIFEFE